MKATSSMAGVDARRHSDFMTMLMDVEDKDASALGHASTRNPSEVCDETIQTVQMTSDALLLTERDMPLSDQSFLGCCDTIIAKSKQVESFFFFCYARRSR
jgi:hypothetical protein